GDLLFVRNRTQLEGIGRIESIHGTRADKITLQCPQCGSGSIELRKIRKPAYRCLHGHLFDTPQQVARPVDTFIARYARGFLRLRKKISVDELRPFELRSNKQLS